MFIINITYKTDISEIEKHLDAHKAFLDKYYSNNTFIVSGRKNPRVGGIIIANAQNREEMEDIISNDPFYINDLADYEVIEFLPQKYSSMFAAVVRQL